MSELLKPLYCDTDSVTDDKILTEILARRYKQVMLNSLYGTQMSHMKHWKGNNMELADTIRAMTSDKYKERFKAEYYQLEIRINKLRKTVDNYEHLGFKPKCSRELLNNQLVSMLTYKQYLLERAKIEDIELFDE